MHGVNMLKTAFLWHYTSNSLYGKLSDLFVLPTVRWLRELAHNTTVEESEIDLTYLCKCTEDLSEREKIVTLIFDEVYTAQHVEYSSGRFIGLTEDNKPAKTMLTFMV